MKKALYRIDEVAEILSMSKRSVYRLLEEGKLIAHCNNPGKSEIRITVKSVEAYLEKYELPPEYFSDKSIPIEVPERKVISKGIE